MVTRPICILEVGSYLRHNNGTGAASCSVSLEVVTTLHLSRVKRLCLVSPTQTRRVQPEFKRKLRGGERFLLPLVSVALHLFGLALLAREVFGLTAGRLQICGGDVFFSTSLKQVRCKGGFVIFQESLTQPAPGEHLYLSKMQIVKKCCTIHLANEKPV